ncbi:MAG: hypothetical protein IID08_03585 [Candidatus Hydrogenedentes bacterium]|nr:hypothetical protein [Candidatus Hydrogenedentota bacterium]
MSNESIHDIYLKLEGALADQLGLAEKGHAEIADSVAKALEALDTLVEKTTARRVSAVSLGGHTQEQLYILRDALDNLDDGQKARDQLAAFELKITEHTDEAAAAGDRIAQLEKNIADLEKQAEYHQEVQSQLETASQRAAELEQAIANRGDTLENAEERIAKLETDLKERAEAVTWSQTRIDELQEETSLAEKSAEEAKGKLDALQETIDTQVQELDAATQSHESLEGLLRDQSARVEELEMAVADASSSADKSHGIEQQLKESRAREEHTASQLGTYEEELADAHVLIDKLEKKSAGTKDAEDRLDQVKKLMRAERERADDLEERMNEMSVSGPESALAEQLAQTLKDREQQQREILKLRREVEELHQLAATAPSDAPTDTGESAKAPRKAKHRAADNKSLMGEILVEAGVISQKQLKTVLSVQRRDPSKRLGTILVEKRYASEDVVAQALALQRNIEFVRLNDNTVTKDVATLLDERLAELHRCIPVRLNGDKLILAMVNPLDLIAIEDVERASGYEVEPVAATGSEIISTIKRVYSA